jgi:hypothetical protein
MNLSIQRSISHLTDFLMNNVYFNRDFHDRAKRCTKPIRGRTGTIFLYG